MARYIGAVCKLCRREGTKLYLKGERCFSDKCSHCGFEPLDPIDFAKSRMLAPPYSFAFGTEGHVVETGRTYKELQRIATDIRSGRPFVFPEDEFNGVLAAFLQAQSVTPRALIFSVLKWLMPPALLCGGFLALYMWKG